MTDNAPFFVDNEVIVLTRAGVWIADGSEISHEPTRKLFAKSLKHDAQGYFLAIGRETKRIEVEDTAYFIHRVDFPGEASGTRLSEGVKLWLNDETHETLDPSTLSYQVGRLACRVKGGTEEARFLHAAYNDLLRSLEEDTTGYFLRFKDLKILLEKKSPRNV